MPFHFYTAPSDARMRLKPTFAQHRTTSLAIILPYFISHSSAAFILQLLPHILLFAARVEFDDAWVHYCHPGSGDSHGNATTSSPS